jgi:hypothetical protein
VSGTWTQQELRRIGDATELEVTSRRCDRSLRPYITIWTVRAGDYLYIRSAHGADNPWFRRATASGTGRIRADGIERDVTFIQASELGTDTLAAAVTLRLDRTGPPDNSTRPAKEHRSNTPR